MNLKGLPFREQVRRVHESLAMATAWWLPRGVAYWAAVRVMAHATTGAHADTAPSELRATDALKRWDS